MNKERIIRYGDEKELLEDTAPAANTGPTTFFGDGKFNFFFFLPLSFNVA